MENTQLTVTDLITELGYNSDHMSRMEHQLFLHICLRVNDLNKLQDAIDECTFEDEENNIYDTKGEIQEVATYFDFSNFYRKFEI